MHCLFCSFVSICWHCRDLFHRVQVRCQQWQDAVPSASFLVSSPAMSQAASSGSGRTAWVFFSRRAWLLSPYVSFFFVCVSFLKKNMSSRAPNTDLLEVFSKVRAVSVGMHKYTYKLKTIHGSRKPPTPMHREHFQKFLRGLTRSHPAHSSWIFDPGATQCAVRELWIWSHGWR